jgi:hypothetical protein
MATVNVPTVPRAENAPHRSTHEDWGQLTIWSGDTAAFGVKSNE